jgi:hypothetical protein
MHQHSTSGIKEEEEEEEEEDTPPLDTWHNARVWVEFFGGLHNDKLRDVRERNVTIRNEICTTNIRSLGFRDIRESVTLWRLMEHSLGCS